MRDEEIQFYFTHQEKINQLNKLNTKVNNHILEQIEKAQQEFSNYTELAGKSSKRLRHFQSIKNRNLMITIIVDGIFNLEKEKKKNIYIAVELKDAQQNLKHKSLDNRDQYKKLFEEKEYSIRRKDFYTNTNNKWAHFAGSYHELTDEQILDLSNTITNFIHEGDYIEIFNRLDKHLTEVTKIK